MDKNVVMIECSTLQSKETLDQIMAELKKCFGYTEFLVVPPGVNITLIDRSTCQLQPESNNAASPMRELDVTGCDIGPWQRYATDIEKHRGKTPDGSN